MRSRAGVSREGVVTPARLASSTSTPDNREGAEEDAMVTSRVHACMMGGMTPLLRPLLAPGMAALAGLPPAHEPTAASPLARRFIFESQGALPASEGRDS